MLMETRNLTKIYSSGMIHKTKTYALSEADIRIRKGEAVGIFGKSGSGKTTLANLIAGVFPPTSGSIIWNGEPVRYPFRGALRQAVQMVDQHPEQAFDPCWSLKKSILEPYRIHKIPDTKESVDALLAQVGLYEEHLYRNLASLSGGELQRAALARAMAVRPELIILDEPTSMLDSISQAQVLQILKDYQRQQETSYLFISHDPDVMRYLCGRCYFLEKGRIVGEEEYSHE